MTPLFGPGWGNYAIQGIVEIQIPEPVSLVPQTPGWWFLLALLIALAARYAWRRYQRWLADAYRREAALVLDTLRARTAAGDLSALRELAPTLRAVASAAAGRERVNGLEGEAWAAILQELAPRVDALPVARIERLAYAPLTESDLADASDLIVHIQRWVEAHEAADA